MCHTEHGFRQGSLPRKAHNLNETQNIARDTNTGNRASSGGTDGQGSHGLGRTACSSVVLLAVFVGEEEESRTQSRMALQKAVESRSDLQEKEHQRTVVPGTGRERQISQDSHGRSKDRRMRQKVQEEEALSPRRGCHLCRGPAVPAFRPRFPEPFSQRKSEQRFWRGVL